MNSRITHAWQNSSRLAHHDTLFQRVPQVPWVGLRQPLPVPEVSEDNSEAAWTEFSGPDEALWRIAT